MADYGEEEHKGNGEASPQKKVSSHGGSDAYNDSKSGHCSRDYDRSTSKARERDREKVRDRDRDQERDRGRDKDRNLGREVDRERHPRNKDRSDPRDRDQERDRGRAKDRNRGREIDRERHPRDKNRSDPRERVRNRYDGDYNRSRDYDRRKDYNRDRDGRHRHWSRSPSKSRSERGSRSRSLSRSKRVSGFDIAPLASAMIAGATAAGQLTGIPPVIPGMLPVTTGQSVATFFSQRMPPIGRNTIGPGGAVVIKEASKALDGEISGGAPMEVRSPSDYNSSLAAAVGLTSGIFVGGLPYYYTEAQIRKLLESVGALDEFEVRKGWETGNAECYALYRDNDVEDIACALLNGIKIGDRTLAVWRASQGTVQPKPEKESVLLHAQQQSGMFQAGGLMPTKVVCLTEMVSIDELKVDEKYKQVREDVKSEGEKYGELVNVLIPRPSPNGELSPRVGKVFLEYSDMDGATKARQGLNGREFDDNRVVAVFYSENIYGKFSQSEYDD